MNSQNRRIIFGLGLGLLAVMNIIMLTNVSPPIMYFLYGLCIVAFFAAIYLLVQNLNDPKVKRSILYGAGSAILLAAFAAFMFMNTKARHDALRHQTQPKIQK